MSNLPKAVFVLEEYLNTLLGSGSERYKSFPSYIDKPIDTPSSTQVRLLELSSSIDLVLDLKEEFPNWESLNKRSKITVANAVSKFGMRTIIVLRESVFADAIGTPEGDSSVNSAMTKALDTALGLV